MNNLPVGPHTLKLMEKIKAEGDQSKEFTQEEKMALVADGMMAPETVGLSSAEEAHLTIAPEDKPKPDFGTTVMLQAGEVPIELRAEWAYQETKIILAPYDKTKFIQDYIKEHSGSHRMQGKMRLGNIEFSFERTYTDPVLGLAGLLEIAAIQLEAAYTGKPPVDVSDERNAIALDAPAVPLQIEDEQ